MLTLTKTTYPQKLFPSDCITLYNGCIYIERMEARLANSNGDRCNQQTRYNVFSQKHNKKYNFDLWLVTLVVLGFELNFKFPETVLHI